MTEPTPKQIAALRRAKAAALRSWQQSPQYVALPVADAIVTVRPAYAMYHDAQRRMAPIIHNEAMVSRMGSGDLLVACWDGREKGGTWQCVSFARRHGKTVRIVEVRKV